MVAIAAIAAKRVLLLKLEEGVWQIFIWLDLCVLSPRVSAHKSELSMVCLSIHFCSIAYLQERQVLVSLYAVDCLSLPLLQRSAGQVEGEVRVSPIHHLIVSVLTLNCNR